MRLSEQSFPHRVPAQFIKPSWFLHQSSFTGNPSVSHSEQRAAFICTRNGYYLAIEEMQPTQ